MPLDINGYNPAFNEFVKFAQRNVNAGDEKAIANAKIQKPLGGRKIVAVTNSLTDEVHSWMRTSDEFIVNDRTRKLFKAAIINMFGGESKIPASVKKAMLLSDYDSGKPLTARRIMAVKAAIDADGTAKARSAKIALETFSPEVKTAALALGYFPKELPRLACAAHFYAQAMGVSEMDAMRAVAEPGSKANRLMFYGGRFMENADNFREGLRLQDLFATWHADLCAAVAAIDKTGSVLRGFDYSSADTLSKLNANHGVAKPATIIATEKFVFEQLAFDPSANLKETDAEKLFGFEHNDACRFIGQDFGHACLNTIGNIPPAKRAVVFKVFNLFCSLATNGAEANSPARNRYLLEGERPQLLSRVLRHLDDVIALDAKGQLTSENIIKLCFPDMVKAKATGNWDLKAVKNFLDGISNEINRDPDDGGKYADISNTLYQVLEQTGASLQEAVDSVRNGKPLPNARYVSTGQMPIDEYGTATGGRKLIEGDLYRPDYCYHLMNDMGRNLLTANNCQGFGFTFPSEDKFYANGTPQGRDNIQRVGNKIIEMCGPVHVAQANSVMMMVSQSGLGNLRGGLARFGITGNEHAPVDFSLSKDPATGSVTIKYTSPEALPFRYEWTATVDIDGKVTSTPMKFEKPVEMNIGLAGKYVDDAAKSLGVKLNRSQKTLAVALLAANGINMYEKNARLFAQFIVKLRLTDASAVGDRQKAADTAKSIRKWRSFELNDRRLAPFNAAVKENSNDIIRDYMTPARADRFQNNIFTTMAADAQRSVFILNGKVYDHRPSGELVSAFKALVTDPKAQKALSSWMNQLCFTSILPLTSHVPLNTGTDAINLPGADAIVNRDMMTGFYMSPLLSTYGHDAIHDLQLSEDGQTAIITQTVSADLTAPHSNQNNPVFFGSVSFTQRLVIDLTQEVPTVTDYKLSQTID